MFSTISSIDKVVKNIVNTEQGRKGESYKTYNSRSFV